MNSYVTYTIKKLLLSLFTIFAVSVFSFAIVQLTPGDPVRSMLGTEADEAAVQATREELNLDKPIVQQYVIWAGNVLHGDFGRSLVLNQEIRDILATRIPVRHWHSHLYSAY